jgi:hypothetical protein
VQIKEYQYVIFIKDFLSEPAACDPDATYEDEVVRFCRVYEGLAGHAALSDSGLAAR